ncbi:acyl-CoA dehydrogenase C-terminal domain-containing protein [Thiofilum flexile]|uniref:acyl-CoA dehydrogenase C-terminal domain-containing protein n=1 Tax=Thiofilum flexile TaxID=125627 RepID=UPI000382BF53|nr:acyl-CoA dehydrogenase C-terminal domain-containing protein [Thiofilum flexile]
MPTYKAPLRDLQFVYKELFDATSLQALPGFEEVDTDLTDTILEEAGRFCETVLQPLNQSGDEEGCHFNNGAVTTPKGFKAAYQAFCENGWGAVTADPTYGGQGLPKTIGMMVEEMICSANMSFGMYPGLTEGAYNALAKFGTDELKTTYLPKMVTGEWSGTMCLTEPHCGTDLGLVRTKAEPQSNGAYKVTGTKIFISAGEQDLTDNIIHLVLARTPDAPAGIKGISLFIVPKYLVNADGSVGAANGVSCGSIEHKMGIKASATCVINFDAAEGYLVGTLNKGMQAMFQMMNTARLGVGIQGLGLSEVSYQNAVAYARDRLQGRALKAPFQPDKPADPLFVHPDVRRMLLTMRAYTEGNRALAIWVARKLDESNRATDPKQKQSADDFVALMTPIVKAFMTDCATDVTNLGVQIYGGHGFIREWGMEQFVRDARITQIYEGTNGIQALDLVGRKMAQNTGRLLRPFFHEVSEYLEQKSADSSDELQVMIGGLMKAFGRLQQATGFIAQQGLKDPDEAAAAATDYLRLFALVALGYLWLRMAEIALAKQGEGEAEFYQAKLDTAQFYFARLLPQTGALLSAILSGSQTLMQFNHEAF